MFSEGKNHFLVCQLKQIKRLRKTTRKKAAVAKSGLFSLFYLPLFSLPFFNVGAEWKLKEKREGKNQINYWQ
jgi:hypothetical protein